jgi:hypothetical protein
VRAWPTPASSSYVDFECVNPYFRICGNTKIDASSAESDGGRAGVGEDEIDNWRSFGRQGRSITAQPGRTPALTEAPAIITVSSISPGRFGGRARSRRMAASACLDRGQLRHGEFHCPFPAGELTVPFGFCGVAWRRASVSAWGRSGPSHASMPSSRRVCSSTATLNVPIWSFRPQTSRLRSRTSR